MPSAAPGMSLGAVTQTTPKGGTVNGIDLGNLLGQDLDSPSYPTRSLNFLHHLNGRSDAGIGKENNHLRWRFVIVGAGLGGLSAAVALAKQGHQVQILEQAPKIEEVGAGIQVPPNSSRILLDWDLGDFLGDNIVEPEGITLRRWKNGAPIGYTNLIPSFRNKYGAPYYVVHRAHFHDALHQLALELGVEVRVDSKVVKYDETEPSVDLADGSTVYGDFIVAADGFKSVARNHIPGEESRQPFATGFAVYRATVDVSKMTDPDIAWLLEKPNLNLWVGGDRHVMTYTISSGKFFNMVLSHVDHSDPATWTQATAIGDMRTYFRDWDPGLVKVINLIDKTLKWPLMAVSPLQKWLSPTGKLIVIGDAAHAMVPYMSQGAAMAVEDGAALAEAFNHVRKVEEIPVVLSIFERVRAVRSSQMVQASFINGKLWHFHDGPMQQARDEAMRPEVLGDRFDESPNQWSDPVTQAWAYGYDAVEEMKRSLCQAPDLNYG